MSKAGPADRKAFIVTGPTSGIGRVAALELATQGTVVLVGRNPGKLAEVKNIIERNDEQAISIVCDLSDLASVRRAATEIVALGLPIAGLLNNAGIMLSREMKSAQGLDMTFATNHLGPFALTEALVSYLPDGANVVFVVSAIEDPERKPAKVMGMRGGRYISAEASAHGEWQPGGCRIPGIDAYATSKQCALASALAFARETPRLSFNAFEPGINPDTGLGGANAAFRFLFGQIISRLPPFGRYRSTPQRAGHVAATVLLNQSAETGVYYDEKGVAMRGSDRAHDPAFQDRVVAETRALLASIPG
jgi:NAD(P)-dependent dehydrogenase (short-subunit alcohol dehydrogenase family)